MFDFVKRLFSRTPEPMQAITVVKSDDGCDLTLRPNVQVFDTYQVDRTTMRTERFDSGPIVAAVILDRALAELDGPVAPKNLTHDESGDE